jgi:dihydrofolate reductase
VGQLAKVRVGSFGVSLDGFSAGIDQGPEQPLGKGGPTLFEWFFETRTWHEMHGMEGGSRGLDDEFAARSMANVGAWILGRNMFGPVRGPWPDDSWKGWWGDEPPYHVPTFVLTHHARETLKMAGGTDFHFVTDGIHSALAQAKAAAGGKDVRIGGGVSTVRQFLQAGLIDDLHLALMPVLMGKGENLLRDLDLPALGYDCTDRVPGERATHLTIRKRS